MRSRRSQGTELVVYRPAENTGPDRLYSAVEPRDRQCGLRPDARPELLLRLAQAALVQSVAVLVAVLGVLQLAGL
jgi:hypothetical protein